MKLKLSLLTLLLLILPIGAQAFEYQGLEYNILDEEAATVEVGLNTTVEREIVIPAVAVHNGRSYTVTEIGAHAFQYNAQLRIVYLPDSLITIGEWAFYGCSGLSHVMMPEGLRSIGRYAFWGDRGLMELSLPKSLITIGEWAFYGCSGLSLVTIPERVKSIGNNAFQECHGLKSVEFPDGLTRIGRYAFSDTGLTSIVLPDGLTRIEEYAFVMCKDLTRVSLPKSLTSIGEGAFQACLKLPNIKIPDGVTIIEDNVFNYCQSLSTVELPAELTSIGNHAFYHSKLTNIVLPAGLTSIGECAFFACDFTSIVVPEGVTRIEPSTFGGCSKLTSIGLPAGLTSIGEGAFRGCKVLSNIILPHSVISIGDEAFWDCSSLLAITLPEGVKNISERTFLSCSRLKSVSIPEGMMSIGKEAFAYCSRLTDIVIPANVKEIGIDAFTLDAPLIAKRKITLDSPTPQIYWKTEDRRKSFLGENNETTALLVKPELFDDLYTTDTEHSEYYYPQPFVLDGLKYESTLDDDHYDVRITDVDGAHEKVSILPTIEAYGTQFNVTECAASFTLRENQYVKELYVDLPMSHIPAYFCADASALEKLTLTENVVSIGEHAFDGTALESVRCEASVPPVCEGYPFGEVGNGTEKIKLIVNSDDVDAYEADEYWGALFSVEADTESAVTEIGVVDSESEVYNLQGVRVERPLVPGVYIVNGRKVVVR